MIILVMAGCSTTRSKDDVKGIKKLLQNTTAKFNGYFNANELMEETMVTLKDMHQDNYNNVLEVYDYVAVDNPQSIVPDMDKAIEKVSIVATLKEYSNYVDDCYVMIGKAQYLKHDYASAEETFQYFEEEFDPKNPYGREYSMAKKKKLSSRDQRKEIEAKRKEKEKEREEEEKIRKKEKEEERKAKAEERKNRKKNSKKKKRKKESREDRAKRKAAEKAEKEMLEKQKESKKIADEQRKEELKYAAEKEKLKKEEEEKKKKKIAHKGKVRFGKIKQPIMRVCIG